MNDTKQGTVAREISTFLILLPRLFPLQMNNNEQYITHLEIHKYGKQIETTLYVKCNISVAPRCLFLKLM